MTGYCTFWALFFHLRVFQRDRGVQEMRFGGFGRGKSYIRTLAENVCTVFGVFSIDFKTDFTEKEEGHGGEDEGGAGDRSRGDSVDDGVGV